MKNRWKMIRTAVLCLTAAALLAGCSLPGFPGGKPTAVSLCKSAVKNLKKAQSEEAQAVMDATFGLSLGSIGVSMDMDMDIDMDMELTRDPGYGKGTAAISLGIMGQQTELQGDFYMDASEESAETVYVCWKNGNWMKKKLAVDSGNTEDDGIGLGAADSSGENLADTFLQSVGLVKLVAEQDLTAELKEETVTVNGKEAWQIDTTLDGSLLKEVLEEGGEAGSIDWDNVEIPARIYIYKDSELPARVVMDCAQIADQLLAGSFEEYTSESPLGDLADLSVEAKGCTIDVTLDRYDEIEVFEIPQEARDAEETEDLVPDVRDFLGGMF